MLTHHLIAPDTSECRYTITFTPPLKTSESAPIVAELKKYCGTCIKIDETGSTILPVDDSFTEYERYEFDSNSIYKIVHACSTINVKVNGYVIDYMSDIYCIHSIKIKDNQTSFDSYLLNHQYLERDSELFPYEYIPEIEFKDYVQDAIDGNFDLNPKFTLVPDIGSRDLFMIDKILYM